jgi:hypothetical protein
MERDIPIGLVGVLCLWLLVTTHKSVYDWFLPAANGWGNIYPIPNMIPPLMAEEEGPPT